MSARQWFVLVLVVVVAGVAFVVSRSGDGDADGDSEEVSVATSAPVRASRPTQPLNAFPTFGSVPQNSTSTSATSSTVTTGSTVPSTTAAPTTTAPPPTTATTAPPPAPLGGLDSSALVAFAQTHRRDTVTGPAYSVDEDLCPTVVASGREPGDDASRDIGDWSFARTCSGVYVLVLSTVDESPLGAFWLEADIAAGGCNGADRAVVGWWRPAGASVEAVGDVIATPSCNPASWQWLDAASAPLFNGHVLQLHFRHGSLGASGEFRWRGYVRGAGSDAVDAVPNSGPDRFVL